MTTYRVKPQNGGWVVAKGNGATVSTHRKKSRAKQSADRKAGKRDKIIVHRANGTVQQSKRGG